MASPCPRGLAKQAAIALTTCLLLPLFALEVLFMGPELVEPNRTSFNPAAACPGIAPRTLAASSPAILTAARQAGWAEAGPRTAAVAWDGAAEVLEGAPGCRRAHLRLAEPRLLHQGPFTASLRSRLGPGAATLPTTLLLHDPALCPAAIQAAPSAALWVIKRARSPAHRPMVLSGSELLRRDPCTATPSAEKPVAQRLVAAPLRIGGQSLEVRVFCAVAHTDPWLVLYHQGYWRRRDPLPRGGHDGTAAQQAESAAPARGSESSLSYAAAAALLEGQGVPPGWIARTLQPSLRRTALEVFHALKPQLRPSTGSFLLLAVDFMVQEGFTLALVDVQAAPAFDPSDAPADVYTPLIMSLLQIQEEVRGRTAGGRRLHARPALGPWDVLHSEVS